MRRAALGGLQLVAHHLRGVLRRREGRERGRRSAELAEAEFARYVAPRRRVRVVGVAHENERIAAGRLDAPAVARADDAGDAAPAVEKDPGALAPTAARAARELAPARRVEVADLVGLEREQLAGAGELASVVDEDAIALHRERVDDELQQLAPARAVDVIGMARPGGEGRRGAVEPVAALRENQFAAIADDVGAERRREAARTRVVADHVARQVHALQAAARRELAALLAAILDPRRAPLAAAGRVERLRKIIPREHAARRADEERLAVGAAHRA